MAHGKKSVSSLYRNRWLVGFLYRLLLFDVARNDFVFEVLSSLLAPATALWYWKHCHKALFNFEMIADGNVISGISSVFRGWFLSENWKERTFMIMLYCVFVELSCWVLVRSFLSAINVRLCESRCRVCNYLSERKDKKRHWVFQPKKSIWSG